ncbi:hypothetical protein RZS08_52075, partial [Arthrospira platensis SPKY1]|nr:hypothetical protein [Arthrospira platensis SPKY1]
DALPWPERRLVGDGSQTQKAAARLLHGVQRRRLGAPAPLARACVAQRPLRLLLLDEGRIHQHDAEQIHRRRRGKDRPSVAQRHETRHQSAVVQVGMREQDEVDRAQIEIERLPVLA